MKFQDKKCFVRFLVKLRLAPFYVSVKNSESTQFEMARICICKINRHILVSCIKSVKKQVMEIKCLYRNSISLDNWHDRNTNVDKYIT